VIFTFKDSPIGSLSLWERARVREKLPAHPYATE
jgi:hypothetical protein